MSRLLSRNSTLVYPDYGMFQIFDCEDYDDTALFPAATTSAPVSARSTFAACRPTSSSTWTWSRGSPSRPGTERSGRAHTPPS